MGVGVDGFDVWWSVVPMWCGWEGEWMVECGRGGVWLLVSVDWELDVWWSVVGVQCCWEWKWKGEFDV